MERKLACECETPSCDECNPDCTRGDRSRWIGLLEVLTGSYQSHACRSLSRTAENGATYDLGYYLPHVEPSGRQADDGLLDVYRHSLRFGLATFDSWDTYTGAPPLVPDADFDDATSTAEAGLWSYEPARVLGTDITRNGFAVGTLQYPNTTEEYRIDTGVRGPQALQGALRAATDARTAPAVGDELQRSLESVRPYGGTPIAAAFDDLYYYLAMDPAMSSERKRDARPYVILIADGYPDDDYQSFGCDCAKAEDPSNASY